MRLAPETVPNRRLSTAITPRLSRLKPGLFEFCKVFLLEPLDLESANHREVGSDLDHLTAGFMPAG
jgi:hypothetical protein